MTAAAFDPNATDFGTDVAWNDDLASVWGLSSGAANYIQACALRLSQRTGSMDFYDPTYICLDLRSYLSAKTSKADKSRLQGRISAALESDPRTQSSAATASFDVQTNTLTVALALQTADGPFDLVFQANKATVAILSVNGVPAPTPVVVADGGATVIVIAGGSSLPGPPGPPGSSNPSRSYGLQAVEDDSGAEVAQAQTQTDINWGALGSSLTIEVAGTGASAAGNAVFRLRRDGSDGAADGTIIATLTASSPSFTQLHGGSTIANPGGYGRVILTVESSSATKSGALRDISFTIQSN